MTMLALGPLAAGSARAGTRPPGRSIEFSGPKSDEVSTNLSQLSKPGDGLHQLEQELRGPFDFLKPSTSFDALPVPPFRYPPVIIPNRRALDRQGDWGALTPEELLLGASSTDDLFTPKRGRSEDTHRSGERQTGTLKPNPAREDEATGARRRPGNPGGHDKAELPPGLQANDPALSRLLAPGGDAAFFFPVTSEHSGPAGAFTFGGERNGFFDRETHKARMEAFRQALIGLAPAAQPAGGAPFNPLDSLTESRGGTVAPRSELLRPGSSRLDRLDAQIGPPQPPPPGVADDKLPGQAGSLTPRPATQPQQPVLTPPVPTFIAPKRPFL